MATLRNNAPACLVNCSIFCITYMVKISLRYADPVARRFGGAARGRLILIQIALQSSNNSRTATRRISPAYGASQSV
jgi:hypothetical protein